MPSVTIRGVVYELPAGEGGSNKVQFINAVLTALAGIGSAVAARVYNSANISISDATFTDLTFNSERYDTNTIHSTSSNSNRITLPYAGKWLIAGHVAFASNATGVRAVRLYKNGATELARQQSNAVVGFDTMISVSTADVFAVNDYVTLNVYQNSGGALNVLNAANYSPEFWCQYLGS